VKTFFTLPQEWRSLSEATKEQHVKDSDIENSESRMKFLLDEREELFEEMKYQHTLAKHWIYLWFSDHYFPFKRLT
jgi:hypothetical protein